MPYGPVKFTSVLDEVHRFDRVLSNLSILGEEEYNNNDIGQPSCGFIVYIDDICCYSCVGPEAEARHMRVLKAVMGRLIG